MAEAAEAAGAGGRGARAAQGAPPRRRQARGEQRMAQILDASAVVFARAGYEKTTTIAIAAEAGISPGSLYQFFSNKEAIAQALADRFVGQLRAAHQEAFDEAHFTSATLEGLLDRMVDPIVAFNVANPGFKALFARTDMPAGLADAARPVQSAMLARVEAMIGARAPGLAAEERSRTARVGIQIFQAMVPLVVAAEGDERAAMVRELKRALHGYLAGTIA
ncbi:TetR/AcrR family transcriptional regulator [Streptomyces sp. NBC_00091]|uniref:TetR/AcrR family transcriptional regulator n=1 Tax=Streptomyces sp. NBC_00091 TaxID=2975648 RepID=UPI0022542F6C|nr:TetR/AcrR family transcriptional regulator [Streptomyces sp. NBC_00091]MCX5380138.1 TetR/AcrR family transcriptional regulator [Streptomyces sp. NBC_00091]